MLFFVMIRLPPISTRTRTLVPYSTRFRSRISALQPHNDRADLDVRDDQRVDRVLRHGVARALLRDRDTVRRGRCEIEHARVDQPVMDDDLGRPQRLDGAHGEQAGIARTGTDKADAPTRAGSEKT